MMMITPTRKTSTYMEISEENTTFEIKTVDLTSGESSGNPILLYCILSLAYNAYMHIVQYYCILHIWL